MISQELLDMLRCPLDPRMCLAETPEGLVCQGCRLRFPVKEGIPCMVPEDAELPAGSGSLQDLPCQLRKKGGATEENATGPEPQEG